MLFFSQLMECDVWVVSSYLCYLSRSYIELDARLDFRRSLVSGLPSPRVRGKNAGSFPEQRLVIEPTRMPALK